MTTTHKIGHSFVDDKTLALNLVHFARETRKLRSTPCACGRCWPINNRTQRESMFDMSNEQVSAMAKGESLMPDNSELTMSLATRAFEMIGRNKFSVSAILSADSTESLCNFGLLQSILLMAYMQGVQDALEEKVRIVFAGSDISQFAKVSDAEAATLLANANIKIVMPAQVTETTKAE